MIFSVRRSQYCIFHSKSQWLFVTRHRLSCEKVNLHNKLVPWAWDTCDFHFHKLQYLFRFVSFRFVVRQIPIVSFRFVLFCFISSITISQKCHNFHHCCRWLHHHYLTRFSCATLLNETVFNSDGLILKDSVLSYWFLKEKCVQA